MENRIILLDPVGVAGEVSRASLKSLADLNGKVLGLLHNGHARKEMMETFRDEFPKRFKLSKVIWHVKKNNTLPADPAIINELVSQADAVIVGVGA